MSATTVQLLQAASDIVGGIRALARHLGISQTLLERFMDDNRELPDLLLLKAVDIILADRQARLPFEIGQPGVLSSEPEISENRVRGNGAAAEGGGG